MLEVLIRRHYREYELRGLQHLTSTGAPFAAPTTPPTATHPPGVHRRSARRAAPGSALVAALGRAGAPARRASSPSSTSTCPGPRQPETPTRGAALLADGWQVLRCRARAAGSPSPSRPGGGRPVALLHLPARPTGGHRRGPPGPRRAPDGRPADDPRAAAAVRRDPARGARRRAALRCVARDNPSDRAAGRDGPGAPARRACATSDGQVIGLPHAERAIANCREAIRRARSRPRVAGTGWT